MSVQDRVAVVTGAGGGLGRLYALALAQAGAKVVVNDYGGNLEGAAGAITRAQEVVNEIIAAGGSAIADGHDVSRPEQATEIIEKAVGEYGHIDILVNNAGISGKISPHDNVDHSAFMRVIEISVLGTTLCTSAAYSRMAKQRYGRIVNISSDAIYGFGAGGDCAYAASKGATFAITRELGRYSETDGIKINCIMPSGFSRMTAIAAGTKKVTETYFDPEKIAPFVVALSSEECPVSGEVFSAAAGRAAHQVIATFPGHSQETTAEGYLNNWDQVMGRKEDIYVPTSCLDHVKYSIRNALGEEMEDIPGFGIAAKE